MKNIIFCLYTVIKKSTIIDIIDIINYICFIIYFFSLPDSTYLNFINNYCKEIEEKFNIKLNFFTEDNFNEINNLICEYNLNDIKKIGLINSIYNVFKEKKILSLYLDFFDKYFTNEYNINQAIELFDNTKKYNSILNLFSGTGNFIDILLKKNIDITNLTAYDSDSKINNICYLNILFNHNINIKNQLYQGNILYDNIFYKKYDLICCDITNDIKNIIYARTCDLIKDLKIRGTKSEPLILQLLLQLLNKNGELIVICPTSLLFCNSKQNCDTRKYLINNFVISKIINLHDKKSLLYIINTNKTEKSIINLYDNNNNNLSISYTQINNNFSLYYNHYDFKSINNTVNKIKLSKIIKIIPFSKFPLDENKYLYSSKFNKLSFDTLNNKKDIDYIFCLLNNDYNDDFLQYILLNYLKQNINFIVKGKMNQICPQLVYDLDIVIDNNIYNSIISMYKINDSLIELHTNQFIIINDIKNNIISNFINNSEYVNLSDLCDISFEYNDTIYIYKNTNLAGHIYNKKLENYENSNNIYFLNNISETINIDYFYIILKYFEPEIIKLANINNTVNLSKINFESFKIPLIPIESQQLLLNNISFLINYNSTNIINSISYLNNNILSFNKNYFS